MHVLLIMFVLGGSIGFVLASMIAADRVAGLMLENKRLTEELAKHRYESETVAEPGQVSTSEPSATFVSSAPEIRYRG